MRYPVKSYSSGDKIFNRVEKELKPADIEAHIKSIADIRVIEGGEARKKGPKFSLKRDADDMYYDGSEIGSEEESEEESDINPFLQKESSVLAEPKRVKVRKTETSYSPLDLESETEDVGLLDGFVVADKKDRIISTSSFATSSKANESAVKSPSTGCFE